MSRSGTLSRVGCSIQFNAEKGFDQQKVFRERVKRMPAGHYHTYYEHPPVLELGKDVLPAAREKTQHADAQKTNNLADLPGGIAEIFRCESGLSDVPPHRNSG